LPLPLVEIRLAKVLEGMLVNQEVVHDAQNAVGDGCERRRKNMGQVSE